MGCFRIVTIQDVQQLREARKGLETSNKMMTSGNVTLTHVGLKISRDSLAQLSKVVGNIGEHITQRSLGEEKAHNLNTTVGHNARIYDVGNQNCIASVKTRGVGQGCLAKPTIHNYVKDLRVATGRSQIKADANKFNAAAQALREAAKQNNAPLPTALQKAQSDKEACDWLRERAELRIPDDHVDQVRSAVKRSVMRDPSAYGLPKDASYRVKADLAKELAGKVQPMGKEIAEIERLIERYT